MPSSRTPIRDPVLIIMAMFIFPWIPGQARNDKALAQALALS